MPKRRLTVAEKAARKRKKMIKKIEKCNCLWPIIKQRNGDGHTHICPAHKPMTRGNRLPLYPYKPIGQIDHVENTSEGIQVKAHIHDPARATEEHLMEILERRSNELIKMHLQDFVRWPGLHRCEDSEIRLGERHQCVLVNNHYSNHLYSDTHE